MGRHGKWKKIGSGKFIEIVVREKDIGKIKILDIE